MQLCMLYMTSNWCEESFLIQVNLIITLSLGSMETDHIVSETTVMRLFTTDRYSRIINLGAMTWSCYTENRTIVRCVIMKLKCL